MRRPWILSFLCIGCLSDAPLYKNNYAQITDYAIQKDTVTPHGIRVDRSNMPIDLELVDQLVDQTEACLIKNFDALQPFCVEVHNKCSTVLSNVNNPNYWKCYDLNVGCQNYERVKHGLDRSQFQIKIAPDWHYACDQKTAVFSCRVPEQACLDKGLHPTQECPCSCRSTIQNLDIITTPQLIVLTGELVRMTTGFNNPWNVPPISHCADIIP